jgi:hypothetical protein
VAKNLLAEGKNIPVPRFRETGTRAKKDVAGEKRVTENVFLKIFINF